MPTPGSCAGKAALINLGGQGTSLQAAGSFSELHDFGDKCYFPTFFLFYFKILSSICLPIYNMYIYTYIFL